MCVLYQCLGDISVPSVELLLEIEWLLLRSFCLCLICQVYMFISRCFVAVCNVRLVWAFGGWGAACWDECFYEEGVYGERAGETV